MKKLKQVKLLRKLKRFNSIDTKSINAAVKVLRSGKLSPFVGNWKNDKIVGSFYGGNKVKELEKKISKIFKVKFAISVNSWTSGLICAVGAIETSPGDEIIVSPWTMCASATAILHWMAVPVFADIDYNTFNITAETIQKKITKRTKAIIVPDIMGQSAEIDKIIKLAKKNNIKVISDSAQAIGVKFKGKYSGTMADIGGYSFNYHKPINCGEGGVVVTNNKLLAKKIFLIRNHGEAVVKKMKFKKINNIIGYNFRLGEIEASIVIEQLNKLKEIIKSRQNLVKILNNGLDKLKNLKIPQVQYGSEHLYYYYALKFTKKNFNRKTIIKELNKRGVPVESNYANLHLLPMYQNKIAYGKFPWSNKIYKGNVSYKKGICPVAEHLNDKEYIGLHMYKYDYKKKDIEYFVDQFKLVWKKFNLNTV